jgi:Zn-dependent peptidase ImmA (M78 family)/transcriptional regulator with XRE-family HTH domain
MGTSVPAHVRPALLAWARKQSGYDVPTVARKLGISETRLTAWETEAATERPTVAQARDLATIYKRPLAVFYLPAPPKAFDVLREYRRLHGVVPGGESPELRYALRLADLRRDVMLELAEAIGETIPRIEGKASIHEDPEHVGSRLRSYLDIGMERQVSWTSAHRALIEWRAAVERRGVLVLQTPGVPLEEMRAATIPSDPLPVILLNTKDTSPQGRIFSLLHEFAHLWLARGGYEATDAEWAAPLQDRRAEVFSNGVAGAALLPASSLLDEREAVREIAQGGRDALDRLRALSSLYSVSAEVVARRLLTLDLIARRRYEQIREQLLATSRPPANRSAPVPIQVRILSHLGRWYTSVLLRAYQSEVLPGSRLSDYLGVQMKYVPKIENELRGHVFGRAPAPEFA